MVEMNECSSDVRKAIVTALSRYDFYPSGEGCYVASPFLDSSGDRLSLHVVEQNGKCIIDDGGYIAQSLERIAERTAAERRSQSLLRSAAEMFGAVLNTSEGVIQIECARSQTGRAATTFMQLLLYLDSSVAALTTESEREPVNVRPSIGIRVASKIARSIRPAVSKRVQRGATVGGLAYDSWQVDFFYTPVVRTGLSAKNNGVHPVVVIGVDLAVKEPLNRASDALARAIDIHGGHPSYAIRMALDTHGQNGPVASAGKLLREYQGEVYGTFDLNDRANFALFARTINAELGAFIDAN